MKKTLLLSTTLMAFSLFDLADTYHSGTTTKTQTRAYYNDDAKNLNKPMIEHDLDYLFKAKETSVDIFATRAFTESNGLYREGFGGGLGINHYFTRYIGFGVDGYAWDGSTRDPVAAVSGNLLLRYPIEKWHMAPYIFAGPGGHFGPETEISAQGGAGLEYRFNKNLGVFGDARYVAVDHQNNYILPRLGLRFIF